MSSLLCTAWRPRTTFARLLTRRAAVRPKTPPRLCFSQGVQRLIRSYPQSRNRRETGGLVFWQFWQWAPGARLVFRGVARGSERVGPVAVFGIQVILGDLPRRPRRLRVVSSVAAQTRPARPPQCLSERRMIRVHAARFRERLDERTANVS